MLITIDSQGNVPVKRSIELPNTPEMDSALENVRKILRENPLGLWFPYAIDSINFGPYFPHLDSYQRLVSRFFNVSRSFFPLASTS